VRHYESVLRALAGRGHDIDLVQEDLGDVEWPKFVHTLVAGCPNIRLGIMPTAAKTHWWELATRFRRARFYLRFFGPAYRDTPALLARARKRAPRLAVRIAEIFGEPGRRLLIGILDVLEQSTRSAQLFHDYLRTTHPDVVVLTPLVVLKTAQLDLARAAMELGIRNVFGVASWDHLSSKGDLNFAPQQVMVWNDVQKGEAVDLHGLDPVSIVVTGSQVFDDWFGRAPSTTREEFCERVGLKADRPIVLYVCSSLLEGSPPERTFVMNWVEGLRKSGHPVLEQCSVLVRPHHEHGEGWRRVAFEGLDNVVRWPKAGDLPVDTRTKSDYFDSLYHASAVVGLNTSAMIEAAILGHPVFTVLPPEHTDSQEGTVHFHYLLSGPNRLLHSARTLDEHFTDLAAALEGRDPDPDRSARFVRTFVRPRGLDRSATAVFVDELETLAARPAPPPLRVPLWTHLVRPLLIPFAAAAARRIRMLEAESRRRSQERLEAHRLQKLPQLLEYRQKKAEENRRKKQELASAAAAPKDTP
jgi:hypothetical protein